MSVHQGINMKRGMGVGEAWAVFKLPLRPCPKLADLFRLVDLVFSPSCELVVDRPTFDPAAV